VLCECEEVCMYMATSVCNVTVMVWIAKVLWSQAAAEVCGGEGGCGGGGVCLK